jgi:Uncharacterized protein conserved in bacteria (DUF2272)
MTRASLIEVTARPSCARRAALGLLLCLLGSTQATAQIAMLARLGKDVLDVTPPSERVVGPPGDMSVADTQCLLGTPANVRQRIVEIAVQEWAFFGFPVIDQTAPPPPRPPEQRPRRPPTWLDPAESSRVASTIAGYWAATPDGAWILTRQNGLWRGPAGIGSRWRDPWSAAFISWVMCSAGLGSRSDFARAIAHHVYIDQAIRSAEAANAATAYVAYDVGVEPIEPGDLLCSSRRNGYRSIADRKRQLGTAARTHCDIVVLIDRSASRILTIGGNVRGTVGLKLQYAESDPRDERLHRAIGHGNRAIFAHLKLRAESGDDQLLIETPTIQALAQDAGLLRAVEAKLDLKLDPAASQTSS